MEHNNGSIAAVDTTITPTSQLESVIIKNTHAAQDILVSFDGGTTYKTIGHGETEDITTNAYSYILKGGGAATTYESLISYYLWGRLIKASTNLVFPIDVAASTYIRVQVLNLDSANALSAEIDIKSMS